MTTKILKSTERGQITLPKQWRDAFGTNSYIASMHNNTLVITPMQLETAAEGDEEVLFDADRDNHGRGVSVDSMIQMLKKIRHG